MTRLDLSAVGAAGEGDVALVGGDGQARGGLDLFGAGPDRADAGDGGRDLNGAVAVTAVDVTVVVRADEGADAGKVGVTGRAVGGVDPAPLASVDLDEAGERVRFADLVDAVWGDGDLGVGPDLGGDV